MKKPTVILLAFIFAFVSCFSVNQILKRTVSVDSFSGGGGINLVIDAGHGGADAGTIGTDGAKEKVINLAIAKKLYDFAMVSGVQSYLIRDGDYLFYRDNDDTTRSDLYNRLDYINSISDSVLISIHQNHFEDESEWGMQIWYSPNDSTSSVLADKILEITKQNLQPDNTRLNKPSDDSYYILYNAAVPSVMVECGFMSNPQENGRLQDEEYQKSLAYSIMLGLSEYIAEEI